MEVEFRQRLEKDIANIDNIIDTLCHDLSNSVSRPDKKLLKKNVIMWTDRKIAIRNLIHDLENNSFIMGDIH